MKLPKSVIHSLIIATVFFLLKVIIDTFCSFHQLHNDYWDLLFIARHIDFGNLATIYNPTIPAGYVIVLHFIIKTGSTIILPILINVLSGTMTVFISLLFFRRLFSRSTAVFAALLVGTYPGIFYYMSQGGADPGSVLLFTGGAYLLMDQLFLSGRPKTAVFFIAGMLMGTGGLFRYHVLIGAMMFILCCLVFNYREWKYLLVAVLGTAVAYAPQSVISLLTHHRLLGPKVDASGTYNLMYRINWYKVSSTHFPDNMLAVIRTDIPLFLKSYAISYVKSFFRTGLFVLAAGVITGKTRVRKMMLTVVLFTLMYFGLFSLHYSGRLILMVIPVTMIAFGVFLDEGGVFLKRFIQDKGRFTRYLPYGAVGIVAVTFLHGDIERISRVKSEAHLSARIEQRLITLGCTSARQVFTSDWDLSFKRLQPHVACTNGGWSRRGTYGYNEAFPEFSDTSVASFLQDCRDRGVKFVLLTRDAGMIHEDLGSIYERKLNNPEMVFVDEVGRIRIYRVDG